MADRTSITDDDQGKPIMDSSGEKIGVVSEVRGGTAYVNPDPGITDTVSSKLGWSSADEDDYPLPADAISTITDDEIRLS
ncbi:PRC-barrel domain containing protein [Halosimplex sp. J119]